MRSWVIGGGHWLGTLLGAHLQTQGFEVETDGDLTDADTVQKRLATTDVIFHFGIGRDILPPVRWVELVASHRPELKRFIHVSSLRAAGPASELQQPRTEDLKEAPQSERGKALCALDAAFLAQKEKLPLVIVRPALVYGPHDPTLLPWVRLLQRKLTFQLRGQTKTGNKYLSALYGGDFVQALAQLAQCDQPLSQGATYLLAAEGVHTYRQVLAQVAERLEVDPIAVELGGRSWNLLASGLTFAGRALKREFPLSRDLLQDLHADYWICSSERARSDWGFSPTTSLDSGLDQTLDWYRTQKWI